ncbi:RNA polymerase sigma factor sigM, partial [Dysosmobacter welbionis]
PKEAETISGRKRGVFMNAKKFSDALSALDGRYVEEAARYRRKHRQSFWVRWGAAAACLCLLAAGGALLIQGRGRAAPDPQQVQIPNPILTVASAAEMEAYLDFKVPVLEKEVEAYSVFISDGYPTMGQVDYADGSQFRIQYGSGDISGIYGGTLEESREIAGVSVAYYQYDSMSYA